MRRPWFSAILCMMCLFLVVGITFAKKKEDKPVQERFEATISPPLGSDNSVSVAIQEFSSEEEVQGLAQTFATGGEGAFEKALSKIKKGFFRMAGGQAMPLMIITSSSAGPVRRLNIIGLAPTVFGGQFGGSVSIGHRGYPYTYIQLEIDERGNGKGALVPYANIVFAPQGRTVVKPMGAVNKRPLQLLNVRKE